MASPVHPNWEGDSMGPLSANVDSEKATAASPVPGLGGPVPTTVKVALSSARDLKTLANTTVRPFHSCLSPPPPPSPRKHGEPFRSRGGAAVLFP